MLTRKMPKRKTLIKCLGECVILSHVAQASFAKLLSAPCKRRCGCAKKKKEKLKLRVESRKRRV